MDLIGSRVGPYQVRQLIGGGGFANVYRAIHSQTGERVALKIMLPHIAQNPQFVRRFKREARALQALAHPNIVRLCEFGRDGQIYYLAMEYLEGPDLSHLLSTQKQLSVQDAVSVTIQVAQALYAANRRGLIHRDIKPSNIKFDARGQIKVLDFGLARAAQSGKLTDTGAHLGTPNYMSPEICRGKRGDIRSDIYSLGIVLYEMLNGKPPFESDVAIVTMHRHIQEAPPQIRERRPDIPAWLETVLYRMIAKNPSARFQSPGQLLYALQNHAAPKTDSSRILAVFSIILAILALLIFFALMLGRDNKGIVLFAPTSTVAPVTFVPSVFVPTPVRVSVPTNSIAAVPTITRTISPTPNSPSATPFFPTATTTSSVVVSACPQWFQTPEPHKGVLVIENHIGEPLTVDETGSRQGTYQLKAKSGEEPGRLVLQLHAGEYSFNDHTIRGHGVIKVKMAEGQMLVAPIWYNDRDIEVLYPLEVPPGCK